MEKTKYASNDTEVLKNRLLVTDEELRCVLGVGRKTAKAIAQQADAVVRVNGRKLNSMEKIRQYIARKNPKSKKGATMEYPKPVMKMGELVKMGFPRSFLDEAYRERGQDFAQKGAKKNSPIFFDTELFEKWRVRKLANENQAMQRGGF